MLTDLLGFGGCAAVILYSGTRLSAYGDELATLTGLSRAWLGVVLMASVTSMPELLTSYSAASLMNSPDLAVGNILGSCLFNIVILALVDLLAPRRFIPTPASPEHMLSAAFGLLMLSVVGVALLQARVFGQVLWVGGGSLVLAVLYLVAIYVLFHYGQQFAAARSASPPPPDDSSPQLTAPVRASTGLRPVLLWFGAHAVLVMLSALALPYFSARLAEASGVGHGFFGTFALALATSLPELVVSLAAVRLGSLDLALGNLFGSNLFNLFVLACIDLGYVPGPLLAGSHPNHLLTVFGTFAVTAISLTGLLTRPARTSRWSPDTLGILLVYGLLALLLYQHR